MLRASRLPRLLVAAGGLSERRERQDSEALGTKCAGSGNDAGAVAMAKCAATAHKLSI
jgi:hypothetical protein